MRTWILISSLCVACAHSPARAPASDWGNAMTHAEDEACSNFECQSFMAPCDLMEAARTRQTTMLEDTYRDRIQSYQRIGYCLRETRTLPIPEYAKGTCFYLMVRGDKPCK